MLEPPLAPIGPSNGVVSKIGERANVDLETVRDADWRSDGHVDQTVDPGE